RPAPSDVQPANAERYGAPCPAPRRARRCAVAQEMCGLPAWTKLSNVRMCLSRLEKPVGLPFGINFAGIHMPMSSRPAILITGAAAGIGRAAAERFARAGWFVGL